MKARISLTMLYVIVLEISTNIKTNSCRMKIKEELDISSRSDRGDACKIQTMIEMIRVNYITYAN